MSIDYIDEPYANDIFDALVGAINTSPYNLGSTSTPPIAPSSTSVSSPPIAPPNRTPTVVSSSDTGTAVASPMAKPNTAPAPITRLPDPNTPVSSSSTSPVTNPSKSQDRTPNNVDDQFSDMSWELNPLHEFHQPTYHIRWFMTDETKIDYSVYSEYDSLVAVIDGLKSTTIVETGITGLSIMSFETDMVVAHAPRSRSLAPTRFNMRVKEPVGVSLMDNLIDAAKELKIKNHSKVPYYIEITFRGYTESGEVVSNPCPTYPNKGRWLFRVNLVTTETTFTEEGSVYNISFVPVEEVEMNSHDYRLPFTIIPTAATIGDMLEALADNLNTAYADMYLNPDFKKYKFTTQPFEFDGEVFNLFDFSLVASEIDFNPAQHLDMDGSGIPRGTFGKGMTIPDIVELIISNSEVGQRLGKSVFVQDDIDPDDAEVKDAVLFRIIPDVTNGEYDFVTESYSKHYNFMITPYYSQVPVLSTNQIDLAKNQAAQESNFNRLIKNGQMVKRYDYLFTGMNTDVINVDIQTKLTWGVVLPRIAGFDNTIESQTTHSKYRRSQSEISSDVNRRAEAKAQIKEIEAVEDQLADAKSKRDASVDDAERTRLDKVVADYEEKLKTADVRKSEAQAVLDETSGLGDEIGDYNKSRQDILGELAANRESRKYAEEITEQGSADDETFPMPVTIKQSTENSGSNHSGVMPDNYSRDRSVYGAIMDQLYETTGLAMQSIDMDIVGDPYWLGSGNVERVFKMVKYIQDGSVKNPDSPLDSTDRVIVDNGDNLFLLRFKYPRGFDDATYNLNLKGNDTFTGVYKVTAVNNYFADGMFKQRLSAQRMPLMQLTTALKGA